MPVSFYRAASDHASSTHPFPSHADDLELCARVYAEFAEMPGLRLTLAQAARLFSIEPDRCQRVLGTLVRDGQLTTDGRAFANPRSGRGSV
jgi:hypothetical protein